MHDKEVNLAVRHHLESVEIERRFERRESLRDLWGQQVRPLRSTVVSR
jgi:hypothetical protein